MTTQTDYTDPSTKVTLAEAQNRATKAAVIAKVAMAHGADKDTLEVFDVPAYRTLLLKAVPRPANRRGKPRWEDASEATWAEVKGIVAVFTA